MAVLAYLNVKALRLTLMTSCFPTDNSNPSAAPAPWSFTLGRT